MAHETHDWAVHSLRWHWLGAGGPSGSALGADWSELLVCPEPPALLTGWACQADAAGIAALFKLRHDVIGDG